jgi:hypothetical protein
MYVASAARSILSGKDRLDEESLVNADRVFSPPRRRRGILVIAIIAALLLTVIVVVHRASPTSSSPMCPSARVRLLTVTSIPGGLGHAGVVVRSSVSSLERCTISGYPTVDAGLSGRSSAKAIDVRDAYLGGVATRVGAPLPRLTITSRPRIASFTIQWADGNGPTCPTVVAIHYSLPGLKGVQTARSMYDGLGNTRFMGIYCHYLSVTPLVKGSTGSAR